MVLGKGRFGSMVRASDAIGQALTLVTRAAPRNVTTVGSMVATNVLSCAANQLRDGKLKMK